MATDSFDLDKEFFIIRSDDLQSVGTKLYGWCLTADNVVVTDAADLAANEAEGRKERSR